MDPYPYLDTTKIQSGNELLHHHRIMETSNSLKTLNPPLDIKMQSPPSVSTLKHICFLKVKHFTSEVTQKISD